MYTGLRPYITDPNTGQLTHHKSFPALPGGCPAVYIALMKRCLKWDPVKRPSFAQLVNELRSMLTAWECGFDELMLP